MDVYDLFMFNVMFNGIVMIFLIIGFVFVCGGCVEVYCCVMFGVFVCLIFFFVFYFVYYYQVGLVCFQGIGMICMVYLMILFMYVVLVVLVLFFVVIIFFCGFKNDGDLEKIVCYCKIVCWIFLIWFYVLIMGVVVYWMFYYFDQVG